MIKTLLLKNKRSLLILLYFSIMPVLMGGIVSGFALNYVTWLRDASYISVFFINFISSVFLALGFIPTTFYSLLCGYIFGWEAIPLVLLSYSIACGLGYLLCVILDNGRLYKFINEQYDISAFHSKVEKSGYWLPVLCRLSPALPFAILNAVFALVKFPFIRYMVGSMAGMLPRTLFAVYVGRGFTHIHSVEDMKSDLTLTFTIIFALISFAGIGWLIKKKLT